MARIRSIKPEFFTSMAIAEMGYLARLAFIGLWTHVDDEGRCIDEPRLIKAALFPLDDNITSGTVADLLSELHQAGRIERYRVEGRDYLQVVGWNHQKIDRKKPSNVPPPPPCDASPQHHDPPLDGSSIVRRAVDDTSSPDRDRIKDQDQGSGSGSSSSRLAYTTQGAPPSDDDEKQQAVIDNIARQHLTRAKNVLKPDAWLNTTRRDIAQRDGPAIAKLIADHPDAPIGLIAARILGERAPTLDHYRANRTCPAESLAEPPGPEAA